MAWYEEKLVGLLFCASLGIQGAHGEERAERTGSPLGTDAITRTVVQFSEPSEITRVLELLQNGRTDDALELAQDYLDSLSSALQSSSVERYFALNALCVALTAADRLDEAIATCSDAIALFPSRWSAINNRGTAYFAAHRFDRALADYRRAREVAPNDEGIIATIDHNIQLCEQRSADSEPITAAVRGRPVRE